MAAVVLGFGEVAQAEDKTLYVAGYGGSFEQVMRKDVLPAFEKANGVKIEYVAGNSTDTLAKLQAQRGNQQIDVIIVDDGPAYQAVSLGFCAALTPADIYKDVAPVLRFKSNKAVGVGLVGTGFMYNKKVFDENKWPAPTSWADLKDPKFKKKLIVPPINNTYGLHALIAEAELAGGGVNDIEPGFKAFTGAVGENVLVYEPSPSKMTETFQNGQAVLAVWGSGRAKAFADTGFPVEFVYPKEGGYALGIASCPVAGSKNDKEAQAFVQYLLSPAVQTAMANSGNGPANITVKLPPEIAAKVLYGDDIKKVKAVDWDVVNAKREEWTKRWNREVER
jgi:putative spermidine/putrescine transport system substrate-binding protein